MKNSGLKSSLLNEDIQKKWIIERVTLIRNNSLTPYYQNRLVDVGLQEIISRIFMLLQRRYVIVVLEHKEDSDTYRILNHTCLDPFWKDSFEGYIFDLYKDFIPESELSSNTIIIDKTIKEKAKPSGTKAISSGGFRVSKIDDYLFNFYGNQHFMFHEVDSTRDRDPNNKVDIRSFRPVSIQSNHFLSYLNDEFQRFLNNERMKVFLDDKKISEKMLCKQDEWENKRISKKVFEDLDLARDWPEEDEAFFNGNHFEKIKEIFDEEYKNIRESPLLVGKYGIPNVFFTIRSFSQKELRFDDQKHDGKRLYPYGVRVLISKTQRMDLASGFKKFREDCCALAPEDRPRIRDANKKYIDGHFWEKLQVDGGIEEILDVLESPYGLGARALSDSVFETGYVSVKNSPFAFGATNRLEEFDLSKGYKSKDYCFAVYFHYMLLMLYAQWNNLDANEIRGVDFCELLVPGGISSDPFFCSGFVFKLTEKDEEKETEEKHQIWSDNLNFYNFIRHNFIRNILNKIIDLYLREIQDVYINGQDDILNSVAKDKVFHPDDVCKRLNPKFRVLARLYPLAFFEFEVVPNKQMGSFGAIHKKELEDERLFYLYYAEGKTPFAVFIRDNPFFLNYIDNMQFLKSSRVKECLREADSILARKLLKKMVYYKKKSGGKTKSEKRAN